MPYDPDEYVPQQYERIPYRFAQLLCSHHSETLGDRQKRLDRAVEMLRHRARHLSTLGREQGQQDVRKYAKRLLLVASLMEGPPMWDAFIRPGAVDLRFLIDPLHSYRIYTTYRRKHSKHSEE